MPRWFKYITVIIDLYKMRQNQFQRKLEFYFKKK